MNEIQEDKDMNVSCLTGRKVWVCGQLVGEWDGLNTAWMFQGVFTTEERAIDACKDEKYFLFPVCLNDELPAEPVLAPDAYYPRIEEELKNTEDGK